MTKCMTQEIPFQEPCLLAVLGIILIVFLTACGCTGTPTVPANPPAVTVTTPASQSALITIQNFAFSPSEITVSKGTTVTWKNQDTVAHQVTNGATGSFADGTLFKSPTLPNGGTYSFTFDTPGTYPYFCAIHPTMKGTIFVT